jgi:gliding motility associated protien GldN
MNILNKITLTLGAVFLGTVVFAQDPMINDQANTADTSSSNSEAVNTLWKPSLVEDGVIDRTLHINDPLKLYTIRELDVAWKRRVWRVIDVRQKQNQPFIYRGDEYTGGGAFIEILIDAVKKGKIQAYSNLDDRFTTPLNVADFEQSINGTSDSTMVEDPITHEVTWVKTKTEFNIYSVTRYRVKEDWIFNRNTGRMEVRIVGLAPLVDRIDESTGEYRYSTPMFWLYYPNLRVILANYEVYNPRNDMKRMTWADYFDGHYFASYVLKTSGNNPLNQDLPNGLRGLQEGQDLVNKIIEREMDMWQE